MKTEAADRHPPRSTIGMRASTLTFGLLGIGVTAAKAVTPIPSKPNVSVLARIPIVLRGGCRSAASVFISHEPDGDPALVGAHHVMVVIPALGAGVGIPVGHGN